MIAEDRGGSVASRAGLSDKGEIFLVAAARSGALVRLISRARGEREPRRHVTGNEVKHMHTLHAPWQYKVYIQDIRTS
jgi:hypothetical protein